MTMSHTRPNTDDVVVKALVDYDKLEKILDTVKSHESGCKVNEASTTKRREIGEESPKNEEIDNTSNNELLAQTSPLQEVVDQTRQNANVQLNYPELPNNSQKDETLALLDTGLQRRKASKLLSLSDNYLTRNFSPDELARLLKAALSKSRKKIPREDLFYRYIYDQDLHRHVNNKNKLARYTKYKTRPRISNKSVTDAQSSWWNGGS